MTHRFVDTHCHFDFPPFTGDEVPSIDRAARAGVDAIIVPAIEAAYFERVLDLAIKIELVLRWMRRRRRRLPPSLLRSFGGTSCPAGIRTSRYHSKAVPEAISRPIVTFSFIERSSRRLTLR